MLSIIIVNWNVRELLKKCLASIFQYTEGLEFEVIVVDNASIDHSADMVKRFFPAVKLIENKTNAGFARANNQGIKSSKGDFILLLNPDTELLPPVRCGLPPVRCGKDNAFLKLVDFTRGRPDAGVVGGRLLNSDGTIQPSCRSFPVFGSQFLVLLKIHNFFPRLPVLKRYFMSDFQYDEAREVDQVMGAFFLIRREVVEQAGLLDEGYGLWFEEVDFCRRAKNAGWKVWFTADAEIYHHRGKSFGQKKPLENQRAFNRSLLRYFKKHHSRAEWFVLWLLQPVSLLLALIDQLFDVKGKVGAHGCAPL